MDRDAIIGNVTTIGKILICTFGTPAMVSFVNSNDYILLTSAILGVIWAILDSKFFNTFFNKQTETIEESIVLNDEYECDMDD